MPFNEIEISISSARPYRLYLFERGGERWAYTNADRDVTYQNIAYKALPISDDGIRATGEVSADQMTVTAPADLDVAMMFRAAAPSDDIWLTLRDSSYGLPDAADSAAVVWVGSVRAVRWSEPGKSELCCNSISASMGQTGLRLSFERSCPHCLYDGQCRVSAALYKVTRNIIDMNGQSIVVSGIDSTPIYAGGIVQWQSGIATERRAIEAQGGNTLAILGGTYGMKTGMSVALYPGCDQTRETGDSRFNNIENFGGFAHMPGKSPFDGDAIYSGS